MGNLSLDQINQTNQIIKPCDRAITKPRTHPKTLLSVSHHRPETEINDRHYFIIMGINLDSAHCFSHCRWQLSTAPDVTHFYCLPARYTHQKTLCLKPIFRSYSYLAVADFPLERDRSYVNYPGNLIHNDENWRIAATSTTSSTLRPLGRQKLPQPLQKP
jgi:hypothetical protein